MPRDHRLDFGIYVAIHREKLSLTGTAVAAACGVTQPVYSNWERCKSLPEDISQVHSLAQKLGLNTAELQSIWEKTQKDVGSKGPAIITRAYDVTSRSGGSTEDPY